ncbi:10475_t:CDS:2 [Entrophospora sp. SA101]|nr:10475_t:CDS:2 [Entrophospora sp. SA101]
MSFATVEMTYDYEEYTYEELIDIAVEEVNDEVENIINENDKSGDTVKQLIRNSTYLKGHKLRLEFWGVIQCGVNIAPPKWCSKSNYEEIQHACSVMQHHNVSESSYGLYVINLSLLELVRGLQETLIYKPGGYGHVDKPRAAWDHLKGAVEDSGNLFGEPQIQQGLPNLGCSPHRDKHYAGIGETRVVSLNSSPTPAAPVFLG